MPVGYIEPTPGGGRAVLNDDGSWELLGPPVPGLATYMNDRFGPDGAEVGDHHLGPGGGMLRRAAGWLGVNAYTWDGTEISELPRPPEGVVE